MIELDRDLIAPLARSRARRTASSTIVHARRADVRFHRAGAGDGELRLVGNLPYNISSPILFHALDHAAAIRDMHFMLQKEVVERMAAGPGSKVYGRLSVMLQAYCRVEPLFNVPPGRVPPAAEGRFGRRAHGAARAPSDIGVRRPARFAHVVRAAFGQRRKTLAQCTAGRGRQPTMIEAAGLGPMRAPNRSTWPASCAWRTSRRRPSIHAATLAKLSA